MKNYRNKQREKFSSDEQKIRFILESRLRLQSVQRYLDGYKIPQRTLDYFKSKEFINNYFMKWTEFQKKNFSEKMVGREHWRKFQEMLEKE